VTMAALFLHALAFQPAEPWHGLRSRKSSAALHIRTSALSVVAPLTELTLDDARLQLHATVPEMAQQDAVLRLVVYAARVAIGAGIQGSALQAANMLQLATLSARSLFTSSTIGTVRNFNGLRNLVRSARRAEKAAPGMLASCVQHACMLVYYPLDCWRCCSRLLPAVVPSSPLTVQRACAALWLLWIVCTGAVSLTSLRGDRSASSEVAQRERSTLHCKLRKCTVDALIAANFMASPVLPQRTLLMVGLLGVISSWQGLRIAAQQAAPQPPCVLTLPACFSGAQWRCAAPAGAPACPPSPCHRRHEGAWGTRASVLVMR